MLGTDSLRYGSDSIHVIFFTSFVIENGIILIIDEKKSGNNLSSQTYSGFSNFLTVWHLAQKIKCSLMSALKLCN